MIANVMDIRQVALSRIHTLRDYENHKQLLDDETTRQVRFLAEQHEGRISNITGEWTDQTIYDPDTGQAHPVKRLTVVATIYETRNT